MRNLFASLITAVGLVAVSMPLAAQVTTPPTAPASMGPAPNKIAYIDTRRVISEAPGTDSAQATMQREMTSFQAQIKSMQDSMQTMVAEFQRTQLVMSADAKGKKEQEIRDKEQVFQQRAQQLQQQAQLRQQQLMEPIMAKIDSIIAEVRKAEGIGIVFDASSEIIVSADPALDLTEKVIARLKAPPAPATAGR